jgi:hypothetical protein
MHTTENSNAVVKSRQKICVSLAILKITIFSLLPTKHVALHTSYNTEIAQHKHTIQSNHNQTSQAIEKELVPHFRFLMIL